MMEDGSWVDLISLLSGWSDSNVIGLIGGDKIQRKHFNFARLLGEEGNKVSLEQVEVYVTLFSCAWVTRWILPESKSFTPLLRPYVLSLIPKKWGVQEEGEEMGQQKFSMLSTDLSYSPHNTSRSCYRWDAEA